MFLSIRSKIKHVDFYNSAEKVETLRNIIHRLYWVGSDYNSNKMILKLLEMIHLWLALHASIFCYDATVTIGQKAKLLQVIEIFSDDVQTGPVTISDL